MVVACTRLLRGSGYAAFNGEVPEQPMHAALASEYAHVTAPLRRLVDRYAGEICVALCAGSEVPPWVLDRLHDLPAIMRDSGRKASALRRGGGRPRRDRAAHGARGGAVRGVVVEVAEKDPRRGTLTLADPAVEAPLVSSDGELPLGTEVSAELVAADLATRKVTFRLVG